MPTNAGSAPAVGFLGAGQMGEAILAGLLRRRMTTARAVRVVEARPERASWLRERYRVRIEPDLDALAGRCDIVVLAIKPQDLEGALAGLGVSPRPGLVWLSIAAGRSVEWLEARLPPKSRVVRSMPNLAMRVGEGMSVYCRGRHATRADGRLAADLLACGGAVRELAEEHFDAATALSGSGPAFFTVLLDAFAGGAAALGLPAADALALALQTMAGTAKVLAEGQASPAEFVRAVTSPKGTTAAGLAVLDQPAMRQLIQETLQAAARRARELGRGA